MHLFHFFLTALLPAMVRPAVNDPAAIYLRQMCSPLISNFTRGQSAPNDLASAIANSPYPCEMALYMRGLCIANGTSPIDFLAEQQCLCNGDFFEATLVCDSCMFLHGDTRQSPEVASSYVSSLSMAECSPNPPYQPFTNLLPQLDATSIRNSPSLTLGVDKFPNNTEISNYYTSTKPWTVGEITGSATARLTSWTNYEGNVFTPTTTPSSSPNTTPPVSSTPTASVAGVDTASTLATSESTGDAMTKGAMKLPGGFMAVIFVVVVVASSH